MTDGENKAENVIYWLQLVGSTQKLRCSFLIWKIQWTNVTGFFCLFFSFCIFFPPSCYFKQSQSSHLACRNRSLWNICFTTWNSSYLPQMEYRIFLKEGKSFWTIITLWFKGFLSLPTSVNFTLYQKLSWWENSKQWKTKQKILRLQSATLL